MLNPGMIRPNQGQRPQQHSRPPPPGETIFVPPSRIRYTQSSIKSTFADGRSLVDTYTQLATKQIRKRDIPMIDVVQMGEIVVGQMDRVIELMTNVVQMGEMVLVFIDVTQIEVMI